MDAVISAVKTNAINTPVPRSHFFGSQRMKKGKIFVVVVVVGSTVSLEATLFLGKTQGQLSADMSSYSSASPN